MKVLFADDRESWHTLIDKVLQPREIEVIHARSLKETLNRSISEDPDVVLIDVSLENGKAYDVIPEIVRNGLPVILIGLKSEGFDEEKAKELGINYTLRKPFTVEELVKTLNEAKLKKRPAEREARIILPGGVTHEVTVEANIGTVEVESVNVEPEKEEEAEAIEVEPVKVEALSEPVKVEPEEEAKPERIPTKPEVSEEEIARITKERVDGIVREIAWEVIPDIAEKVIREEIEKFIKSRKA